MRRCVLLCLTLVVLSGCRGDDVTKPFAASAPPPSKLISDGNHHSGNPDFFFLPPLVKNPSGSTNWENGAFDGTRTATVRICELTATSEIEVPLATCSTASGAYVASSFSAVASPSEELYKYNWKVPTAATKKFYRLSVLVLTNQLGVADIEAAPNASQLKNANTSEFVTLTDGSTLPIKFRIERNALRQAVVVVNLAEGGTVSTTFPGEGPGSGEPSGVTIPPQSDGGIRTITVQQCVDLNDRVIDLPTFGHCVRVTSDPALSAPLLPRATVFDCGVGAAVGAQTPAITSSQERRITFHRFDTGPDRLAALPHVDACGSAPALAFTNPSLAGMLASLSRGHFNAAAKEAAALLLPKPAYATMFIDLGGGGLTEGFSDFQFALPSKLSVVASTNNQTVPVGSPIHPAVMVTDLAGEPVRGARVRFEVTDGGGSVTPTTFITGADGLASDPGSAAAITWTIGTSVGSNTLKAYGRGLAGLDNSGPRVGVDPFQPIQSPFDDVSGNFLTSPVPVLSGAVTISATGVLPYGSGWTYLLIGSNPAPNGWETPTFGMEGWSTGNAPFGANLLPACPNLPAVVTTWPLGSNGASSDILLRKTFSTSTPGTLQVTVRIDNDVEVFVDGIRISGDGFFLHEGCADVWPASFTFPDLPAGNHVLALRARDRGVVAFVDATVSSPRSQ